MADNNNNTPYTPQPLPTVAPQVDTPASPVADVQPSASPGPAPAVASTTQQYAMPNFPPEPGFDDSSGAKPSSTKRSTKNKVLTGIGIVFCVILVPLLIMNTTIIVRSFLYPDKVPDFFGIKPFIVLSGSMAPEINIDDLVVVREADIDSIDVGTTIAYRGGDIVTIHKVIEKSGSGDQSVFVTQGVANNAADQTPVVAGMVEGVHWLTVPKIGGVALFMQTPTGMIVCLLLPLVILLTWSYMSNRRTKKQLEAQLQEKHGT